MSVSVYLDLQQTAKTASETALAISKVEGSMPVPLAKFLIQNIHQMLERNILSLADANAEVNNDHQDLERKIKELENEIKDLRSKLAPEKNVHGRKTFPCIGLPALMALRSGRKIDAIKILREDTGWGLKDSKDYVEDFGRLWDCHGSVPWIKETHHPLPF